MCTFTHFLQPSCVRVRSICQIEVVGKTVKADSKDFSKNELKVEPRKGKDGVMSVVTWGAEKRLRESREVRFANGGQEAGDM